MSGCFSEEMKPQKHKSGSLKLESCFMKGNTQNMDRLDKLEIYIPVEAEVKSIPLWSLPNSVLRRMDIPLPDSEGSRKLADSPEGICICPAVIQRKGQKSASQTGKTGNSIKENMSSLLASVSRAAACPFRMSFVSSNPTAYKVLKETTPEKRVSSGASLTSSLPVGSAPRTNQDAVVIYCGRIYLSIRNSDRSQSLRETPGPQSSVPPTSLDMSSQSRKKRQSPESPLETADKKRQNKRLCVTSTRISPKDLPTKTDNHSTTDQELLNNSEMQDPVCEEAESTSQNNDTNNTTDSGGPENTVGTTEQSSNQNWTRRESQGAAGASTSLQQEFDFNDLEQQERIGIMKAKLSSALNRLHPS